MTRLKLHRPVGGLETVSGVLLLSGSVPRGATRVDLYVDGVGWVATRREPLANEPPVPPPEPGWDAFHAAFVAPVVSALSVEVRVTRDDGVEVIEPDLLRLSHRQARITARVPLGEVDVIGALDEPAPGQTLDGDRCRVSGWVGAVGARVVAVWAEAGGERAYLARGGARPDVAHSFPDVTDGDRSGFAGELWLPESPRAVELFVELSDGGRLRWLRRAVRRAPAATPTRRRPWWARLLSSHDVLPAPTPPKARPPLNDRAQRDHDHTRSVLAFPRSPGWRRELSVAGEEPVVTFLLPLSGVRVDHVEVLMRSLLSQTDARWRLLATDDGTSGPYLASRLQVEPRIELRPHEGTMVDALGELLEAAPTPHVAILDAEVSLAPDALSHLLARLENQEDIDLLTSDEDERDIAGRLHSPVRKPPPNLALRLGAPRFGRLSVFRRSKAVSAGGFDPAWEGAHEEDLFLRMLEAGAVASHLPVVTAHRRAPWQPHARLTACLEAALERRGLQAELIPLETPGAHRVVLSDEAIDASPVTVLIPTRDRVDLLRPCLDALRRTVAAARLTVLIVDDHSVEPKTHAYLRELAEEPGFRVVRDDREPRAGFNFARLVNFGVDHVQTPSVLLLNNDTVATRPGWLAQMAAWLARPNVGAVGARLLYADGTVQHAGVTIGVHGGLADHLLHGTPGDEDGYLGLGRVARDTAAVTGACLMTDVALYRSVGGLDEARFGVDYNDIDYCLRLHGQGKRVIYAPEAELVHLGSASRGGVVNPLEKTHFIARHGAFRDPYLHPAFDTESSRLRLDPHRFEATERVHERALSIRVVASEPPGDASSELEDLVEALVQQPGVQVELEPWEPVAMGDSGRELRARLRDRSSARQTRPADVIVAHGPGAFHAIERARQLGCASVLHVTHRADFEDMAGQLGPPPVALDLYRRAVSAATRVLFASPHIRETYRHLALRDHFRIFSPGVSLSRLRALRERHPRAVVRERADIRLDASVVVLAGPDASLGAARAALEGLDVVVYRIEGSVARPCTAGHPVLERAAALSMADLLLLAAGPPIFPRHLLEAMAFGLTVIGPREPGIGDVVGPGVHGFMVDMRSRSEVRAAVSRCLLDPVLMRRIGDHAAVQIRLLMSSEHRIDRYVELLHEARVAAL